MLHIILAILKIIGIALAAVLLLLLLLFLLLMFVPLRYELKGKRYPKVLEGGIQVSWLLHLITFRAEFRDGCFQAALRICGFTKQMFPESGKPSKKRRRIPKRTKDKSLKAEELSDQREAEDMQESGESEEIRKEPEEVQANEPFSREHQMEKEEQRVEPDGPGEESKGILGKIQDRLRKLRKRIMHILQQIREGLKKLLRGGSDIKDKIIYLKEQLVSDLFRSLFQRYRGFLMYLWRHLGPRKVRGSLRFGFGDPSLTGQAAGILYLVLPERCRLEINPDFKNIVLEGELSIKGHIRACHLAVIGWRVFRDRELRLFIKKWKA